MVGPLSPVKMKIKNKIKNLKKKIKILLFFFRKAQPCTSQQMNKNKQFV